MAAVAAPANVAVWCAGTQRFSPVPQRRSAVLHPSSQLERAALTAEVALLRRFPSPAPSGPGWAGVVRIFRGGGRRSLRPLHNGARAPGRWCALFLLLFCPEAASGMFRRPLHPPDIPMPVSAQLSGSLPVLSSLDAMAREAAVRGRRADRRERAQQAARAVFSASASGDGMQVAAHIAWHAARLLVRRDQGHSPVPLLPPSLPRRTSCMSAHYCYRSS